MEPTAGSFLASGRPSGRSRSCTKKLGGRRRRRSSSYGRRLNRIDAGRNETSIEMGPSMSIRLVTLALLVVLTHTTLASAQNPTPTVADEKYGPHERNVLDFWKADSKTPAPVIV